MQKPDHPQVPATSVVNEEENEDGRFPLQCFACAECTEDKGREGKRSAPIEELWHYVLEQVLKESK